MSGVDVITELKPPIPTVPPIIEAPTEVAASIIPEITSDTVSKIEDGLAGEVPPEDIITDLASGTDVDTTRPRTDGEASSLPATPEEDPSTEDSDFLDWDEVIDSADLDKLEEVHDSFYPEPELAEDPVGHLKWLKQKMNTMESSLIERAVNKRLERWEKKNPAPSVDNKDAHDKWLQDKSEVEKKLRESYKRKNEKEEGKKEKEGELNEAQILKLTAELKRKSQISADYAAAIEGYRSQPPTRENQIEIAKYQFAKQATDQEIERINQLLSKEVEKAPLMKKIRLMALIAGAVVAYGTFKAAKSAEQPAQ